MSPTTPPPYRLVEYTSEFVIAGRGRVVTTTMPDPVYEPGERVIVDDVPRTIAGIEAFATLHGRDPGQPVGLLLATDNAPEGT